MVLPFDDISRLNAITNPIVNTDILQGGLVEQVAPSLDTCLLELAFSLATARNSGLKDSETKKYILNALTTPFNEAARALSETFIPDPQALQDAGVEGGVEGYVSEYTSQVVESLKNPISAILQQQKQVFQQNLDEVGDIIVGGSDSAGESGVVTEVYDRLKFILNELFLDEQQAGANLGGMLVFAVDEVLPSIDMELQYLRRMRAAVSTVVEQSSKIPKSMVPQLPSLVGFAQMCEVDEHLRIVARDLRIDKTWNRSEFNQATSKVCLTKDLMLSGIIPFELRGLLKNITGWDDRQLNAIQDFSFMPNIEFRAKTIQLVALNNFVQQADVSVVAFHRNLQNVLDTLESVVRLNIGDVLALIIDVLRSQINSLKADMESQSQGFTGALPRGVPNAVGSGDNQVQIITNADLDSPTEGLFRRNKKYADDVYAQMSSQLGNYVVLSGLCFIMERTQRMYLGIQSLLSANNRFTRLLLDFIGYYRGSDCGNDDGAADINNNLQAFLESARERISGRVQTNIFLQDNADRLVESIRAHERFLICIRDRMFLGKSQIIETATNAANVLRAVKNIWSLVDKVPDLYNAIRELDLKKLFGIEAVEYNALDAIMRSLQCVVLQCDNQYVASVARLAQTEFQKTFDKRKARTVTVGSLDELPKASRETAINARVASFTRVIRSIQNLTSFDINELCNIDTDGRPTGVDNSDGEDVTPTTADVDLDSFPEDEGVRRVQEEAERRENASNANPYGNRL